MVLEVMIMSSPIMMNYGRGTRLDLQQEIRAFEKSSMIVHLILNIRKPFKKGILYVRMFSFISPTRAFLGV